MTFFLMLSFLLISSIWSQKNEWVNFIILKFSALENSSVDYRLGGAKTTDSSDVRESLSDAKIYSNIAWGKSQKAGILS